MLISITIRVKSNQLKAVTYDCCCLEAVSIICLSVNSTEMKIPNFHYIKFNFYDPIFSMFFFVLPFIIKYIYIYIGLCFPI